MHIYIFNIYLWKICVYKHIYSTERKRGRERQRIYRSLQWNEHLQNGSWHKNKSPGAISKNILQVILGRCKAKILCSLETSYSLIGTQMPNWVPRFCQIHSRQQERLRPGYSLKSQTSCLVPSPQLSGLESLPAKQFTWLQSKAPCGPADMWRAPLSAVNMCD